MQEGARCLREAKPSPNLFRRGLSLPDPPNLICLLRTANHKDQQRFQEGGADRNLGEDIPIKSQELFFDLFER